MINTNNTYDTWLSSKSIVVCIPCLNEATTIGQVIQDYQRIFPRIQVRVYDNNSSDTTVEAAKQAGAQVRLVSRLGKGNVIQRVFEDSNEDLLILIDGDATYPVKATADLLNAQWTSPRSMVVGSRKPDPAGKAFRRLHNFGNWLISGLASLSFGHSLKDVLSGYRVLPRSLYKSLALNSQHFDIETEITLQVLAMKAPIIEIETPYYARPTGSESKLNTWHDGFLILKTIALLVRYYRPFFFFTCLSVIFLILGLIAGWSPINDYIKHDFVYHVPLALLAASLVIISAVSLAIGLILDSIRYYHLLEMKRLNRDI